jgi:hypothetical protein
VGVFGAAAAGSGRSSGAAGVGVRLGAEVMAFGQAGGQPGEEHGRAEGGDRQPTARSGWGGTPAGWERRRATGGEIWLGKSTGGWHSEMWLGTVWVSLIRARPVSVNFCRPPNSR